MMRMRSLQDFFILCIVMGTGGMPVLFLLYLFGFKGAMYSVAMAGSILLIGAIGYFTSDDY